MVAPNYNIEREGSLAVATVNLRQLTGNETAEICHDMRECMRNDNTQFFVMDMSDVEFMDSACVGVLVEFLQDLEHVRGRIALANCRPNVEFLFKVTRLDSVFRIFEDLEEARGEFVAV